MHLPPAHTYGLLGHYRPGIFVNLGAPNGRIQHTHSSIAYVGTTCRTHVFIPNRCALERKWPQEPLFSHSDLRAFRQWRSSDLSVTIPNLDWWKNGASAPGTAPSKK